MKAARVLTWLYAALAALLLAVGMVQVVQIGENADQNRRLELQNRRIEDQAACLQSVVSQLTDRSKNLSNATGVRDKSFAHLVDVLLDEKATDKERLSAFTDLKATGAALVQARAENKVPDIDERCG